MFFRKRILHRYLLILQRLSGSIFDALNAPNVQSRQASVNVVERVQIHYSSFIGRMNVIPNHSTKLLR